MIAFLEGVIIKQLSNGIILNVKGVGYHIFMSVYELGAYVQSNETVSVWIHMLCKEGESFLFGFLSWERKEFFKKLLTIKGMGPKTSLHCLSTFTPQEFLAILSAGDLHKLSSVSGIGERMVHKIKETFLNRAPTRKILKQKEKRSSSLVNPIKAPCLSHHQHDWLERGSEMLQMLGFDVPTVYPQWVQEICEIDCPSSFEDFFKAILQRCAPNIDVGEEIA